MNVYVRKIRISIVLMLIGIICVPINSLAASPTTNYVRKTSPDVVLTELETGTIASSGQEFVELYNNTDTDIDFADVAHSGKDAWKLQYFAGSKLASLLGASTWTNPYRTINLTGSIPAHDYYVLASTGYQPGSIDPDQNYSATLADDGGALQLTDAGVNGAVTTQTVHDQLAWSNDKTLPSNSVLYNAPGAGASLQRQPNSDSQYVNDDSTLTGFTASSQLSPDNAWTAPVVPVLPAPIATDPTNPSPVPAEPTTSSNQGLINPAVTEVLPNPAAPQTDEANEFIELYNPNDTAYDLRGYILETGQTTLHDFTFTDDVILQPHSYQAFYSADTNLSLSNSSGQARLLAPDNSPLSQSDAYGTAADGQAWALDPTNGTWRWTITPTPGAENTITPPFNTVKVSVVKTASVKTKTAKVKGVSTTKKAKAAKAKAKKKSKVKAIKSTAGSQLASTKLQPTAPIHPAVLAAVGALAVGYGIYEYRKDIGNRIVQLRTNRAARRKARS